MISKFLASRFSGYLAIGAVIVILGLVFYIYNEGKKACVNQVVNEQVEAEKESKKGSDNVRKKVQSLDEVALDRELCGLGIVRGNTGCQ